MISSLIWWDHPQIDGNFPLLLTLHEEPLKPERHLGKDVPISKVNQLGFPAGKKCNRCQFRFGLVVIINQGTPKVPNKYEGISMTKFNNLKVWNIPSQIWKKKRPR